MNDEAFLSTAAQVIPVLLLVLFIEDRRLAPADRHSAAIYLLVLVPLAIAEFTALTVEAERDSLEVARGFIMCAIMLGLIALIGPLLRPGLEPLGRAAPLLGIVYMLVMVSLVALQIIEVAVAGLVTMGILLVLAYFYDPYYRRPFRGRRSTPESSDD